MDIVIPTCGRIDRQVTLEQLSVAGLEVALVVQDQEYNDYNFHYNSYARVVRLPKHIKTIAPTRQWIIEHIGENDEICMVDDDLWFYKRRSDNRARLRDISPRELNEAFGRMDTCLKCGTAHVGFAPREGANRNVEQYIKNTRIMRVLGYRRDIINCSGVRFDDMECMEDFHVALSLLESGHTNLVLNDFAHNQAGGSAADGGCSSWRTPEVQAANARKLKEYHPDYVTVVEKKTKTAWGGGIRVDVRVQWKKAYERSGEWTQPEDSLIG